MISMLVVAGVATFFALNMLMDGLDNAVLSTNSVYYENARMNVLTCLEDYLLRIKKNPSFTSPLNYTISEDNTCSATSTWFPENQVSFGISEQLATLDLAGASQDFSRTFRYEIRVKKFDVHEVDGSVKFTKSIDFISVSEL